MMAPETICPATGCSCLLLTSKPLVGQMSGLEGDFKCMLCLMVLCNLDKKPPQWHGNLAKPSMGFMSHSFALCE